MLWDLGLDLLTLGWGGKFSAMPASYIAAGGRI